MIVFDGTTSRSKKISMRVTSWQPIPVLRNNYVAVPGRAGVTDFGSTGAERIIEVQCSVFPQEDFAALVGILDDMAEWLNPDNGLKQLIIGDVPGRYYMARLSDAVDVERLIRSSGNFTLRFVCPDPHAYAMTDETFTIASVGTHTVTRAVGNTNSEPVYYLHANIGLFGAMRIRTNEDSFRLGHHVLRENETLIIDSGRVTAVIVNRQSGETLRNGCR